MHGLDEYDSKARWYYPAICRTTTMDPLAETYYPTSPYEWCGNNPVKNVDLDGMDVWELDANGSRTYSETTCWQRS
jgi:RHS repeat-associated protein